VPGVDHEVYPYLLRDLVIDRPNQVWCADITYIQMQRGYLYLVAIMDWVSRKVLAWRLSNTMDTDFCIEALEEALAKYGTPEIFNSDQGSQFTSPRFTGILKEAGVKISMDGKGRWMDNVFIERLWRSLKYECVYLHPFENGTEARNGIGAWMQFYATQRPHSALAGLTPDEAYAGATRLSTTHAKKQKKQQQEKLAA
jgi:putative transposase